MLHHYSTCRHCADTAGTTNPRLRGRVTWSLARIASDLPREPVVDVVADGLTEDEIPARFETWLSDLDSVPTVDLSVSAADELRSVYAEMTCDDRRRH